MVTECDVLVVGGDPQVAVRREQQRRQVQTRYSLTKRKKSVSLCNAARVLEHISSRFYLSKFLKNR